MRFITKVTVTGADDSNDVRDLQDLALAFPFVEFGILLSRKAMGQPRFPSKEWLRKMVDALNGSNVSLSGHICGSWVREILVGNWPFYDLSEIHPSIDSPSVFKRFQLNTHAEPHMHNAAHLQGIIATRSVQQQKIIIQKDDVNNGLLDLNDIEVLFDLSHGAGVLPTEWPRPIKGVRCGYAGGLSPDNVVDQIHKIQSIVGDHTIWIDAETHLRSYDQSDRFDLDKVIRFLDAAEPYVVKPSA